MLPCDSPTFCPPSAPQLIFMQGLTGATGPVAVLRGTYDGTQIYYENTVRRDFVVYAGFLWAANAPAKNGGNSWGVPNVSGGDWLNTGLAFTAGTNSYGSTANNTGDSTVTPTSSTHTQAVAITGAAGTRNLAITATQAVAGDIAKLVITLPATLGIILKVQNGTVGGAQLLPTSSNFTGNAYTTNGVTLSATWEFYFNGTQWVYSTGSSPA